MKALDVLGVTNSSGRPKSPVNTTTSLGGISSKYVGILRRFATLAGRFVLDHTVRCFRLGHPRFQSLLWISAVCAAAGCAKSDEKSCAEVAGHIVKMARTELVKADAKTRKNANANLPTLQNSLMESCESQKWPQHSRLCILDAITVADTVDCKPESMPTAGSADAKPSPAL